MNRRPRAGRWMCILWWMGWGLLTAQPLSASTVSVVQADTLVEALSKVEREPASSSELASDSSMETKAPWMYWGVQDTTMTAEGLSNRLRTLWRLGLRGLCLPSPVASLQPGSSLPSGSSLQPGSSLPVGNTLPDENSLPSGSSLPDEKENHPAAWALTHAFREAARLDLPCGLRLPLGTPMPRVMWSDTLVTGDVSLRNFRLSLPVSAGADYRDIAVYAVPQHHSAASVHPDSCLQLPLYQGKLTARLPEGEWRLLRMGYGQSAAVAEDAESAPCFRANDGKGPAWDRFDGTVVRQQFVEWWKTCGRQLEHSVVSRVLKRIYVDSVSVTGPSWLQTPSLLGNPRETSSVSAVAWSEFFPKAFEKRRGYDLLRYLPVLAGVPLEDESRRRQVRQDIVLTAQELEQEVFYPALQTCVRALNSELVLFDPQQVAAEGLPYWGDDFILLSSAVQREDAEQTAEVAKLLPLHIKQWTLHFPGLRRSVVRSSLGDWRQDDDAAVRRFTGSAVYRSMFMWRPAQPLEGRVVLRMGQVAQVAQVRVNSLTCGPTLWTGPYEVDITEALSEGPNTIEVEVVALVRPEETPPVDAMLSDVPASDMSLLEASSVAESRVSHPEIPADSLSRPDDPATIVLKAFAATSVGKNASVLKTFSQASSGKNASEKASVPAGWLGPCEFWHIFAKKSSKSLQIPK